MTHFIFKEATWLGQGHLSYTQVKEKLPFNTRWEFKELSPGVWQAKHRVEIEGAQESHSNLYTFFVLDDKSFRVVLQNSIIGQVEGLGFIEGEKIGWKIKSPEFEGYEVFSIQPDGTYSLDGEYFSQEISSQIVGKLWKKFQ